MPFDDLEKKELISILELIEQAQRAAGAPDMQKLILRAAGFLEAEFAVCGLARTGIDGLPAVTSFVNGNYPEEFARSYMRGAYYRKDPVTRFHTRYALTRTWSEVFREFEDNDARRVVAEAADYGLRFGVTGALYVPEIDNVAIFTFAGRRDKFGERQKRLADILATHFTRALSKCSRELLLAPGAVFAGEGYPEGLEGKA